MPIGNNKGFTYIGLLIIIAIAGIGLSAVGVMWKTEMQRERENELLFIGNEFSKALADYYKATPGGIQQLPKSLNDLILDKRFPVTKRHLRKLYIDPMTGKSDWGLLMQQDAIAGIFSLSYDKPFKKGGFEGGEDFSNATSYRDWHFAYQSGV